jgi:hypothetical protein
LVVTSQDADKPRDSLRNCSTKGICRVTAGAVGAESATVDIVDLVATCARTSQCRFPAAGCPAMAGPALQLRVGTVNIEFCLTVVIEQPKQPIVRVMAIFTARPQSIFMHIIVFVAIDALCFCVFVCSGYVALLTRRRGMQANQRKRCDVVFEQHIATPAGLSVTRTA